MKYFKILQILLFSSIISFYACNDKAKTSKPSEAINSATPPKAITPNPATLESPQNASGVWHYTCSKGCAGGAGSAVNCNTCGGTLVHNSAYHAKANSTPNTDPNANAPFAAPAAKSGQNTAGVWHYTCGKGCAGGSGAAGNCGTCGDALAHNAAYHQ